MYTLAGASHRGLERGGSLFVNSMCSRRPAMEVNIMNLIKDNRALTCIEYLEARVAGASESIIHDKYELMTETERIMQNRKEAYLVAIDIIQKEFRELNPLAMEE